MNLPKYCCKCGLEVHDTFLGSPKDYFRFEDGPYCVKCAKVKVEKARKEIK